MESTLDETKEDLRELLDAFSIRHRNLKNVDKLLEGHKDHILSTYIFWLQEEFIANTASPSHLTNSQDRASLLQSWCARLHNHGFDPQHIFDAFCDCTEAQIKISADNRLVLEKVKEKLRKILFHRRKKHRKRDQPPVADNNARPSLHYVIPRSSKINSNEEHHKDIMDSRETENTGIQKPDLIKISYGHDSEVGSLGQRPRHHRLEYTRNSLPLTRDAKQAPRAQDEQFTRESKASQAQHSKSNQYQTQKVKEPHEYICYRCEVPGHLLHGCPTNLDPSFDRVPVGGYNCRICGKIQAHLTSLCPENTDPRSLTQLRLKHGVVTTRRPQGQDSQRPDYGKKVIARPPQQGKMYSDMEDVLMSEDSRYSKTDHSEYDEGEVIDLDRYKSRYMGNKRTYSCQKSPQNARVIDRYTSPSPKRMRKDDVKQEHGRERARQSDWESDRDRQRLIRPISPGGDSRSINHHVLKTPDIFGSLTHPQADCGRLSYWDSKYETPPAPWQSSSPKYHGPDFSSSPLRTRKQPPAEDFWSEDCRVEMIKHLFPNAEAGWVIEMAGFDVDQFFKEMDCIMLSTPSDARTAVTGMDVITDVSYSSDPSSCVVEALTKMNDVEECEEVADPNPCSPRHGYVMGEYVGCE